jgi:hypothetical protein
MKRKITQTISSIFLIGLLFLTSCSKQPPSRFENAQQQSTQAGDRNTAVVKEAEKGGSFNTFFPASSDGYERVFTQEKKGFVQAKIKKDGKEMAMISVFDTLSNPATKNGFDNAKTEIKGYPAMEKGSKTTAVLVGDRFQVKISSSDPSFTPENRLSWLQKFDLDGLAKLK